MCLNFSLLTPAYCAICSRAQKVNMMTHNVMISHDDERYPVNEIKCVKNRVIHHMLSENNDMTLLLIKTWTTPHEKNVMPCRKCLISFHVLASGSGHARFTVSMNCKIRKEIPGLQVWGMLELSVIWGFRFLLKKVPKSDWKHYLIITRDHIVIQSHKPHPPFILMSTAHL